MEELKFKNLHKFKVGDWIVFNGLTLYIKEIVKGYYRTISKGGITNSYDWDIDNLARLWSIEEAEIGDTLRASDGSIFIYAGLKDVLAQSYIALLADGDLNTMKCNWEDKTSVAPATKEQRDLLFCKMKEAGYVWDADKKELRKINKITEKVMTQEELKEILECDEIRDTWEYVQEFVEKFGKIPEDQDELVVCVNYVLECMQDNHQISVTDEWQVTEGLYKCTKRMFDGTPESKILFEVGEVYKCLSKHDIAEFEVSYGHSVFLIDPVVKKHFIPNHTI